MHWLSPSFYTEAQFGPSKKSTKNRLASVEMNFFRTTGYTLFDHKRNKEILGVLKVEPVDEKPRILAATCNKNEQQPGVKNNAELSTKWTNTIHIIVAPCIFVGSLQFINQRMHI